MRKRKRKGGTHFGCLHLHGMFFYFDLTLQIYLNTKWITNWTDKYLINQKTLSWTGQNDGQSDNDAEE